MHKTKLKAKVSLMNEREKRGRPPFPADGFGRRA